MSPARLDLGGSNRVALTRAGDLVDNKEVLGDGRKLLTDARETSYWICRSLLTAACSTVELAEPRNTIFFIVIQTPK
jgi:hypothetical protein